MSDRGVVVQLDVENDLEYPAHEFGSVGEVDPESSAGVLDRGDGRVGGGAVGRGV